MNAIRLDVSVHPFTEGKPLQNVVTFASECGQGPDVFGIV